MIAKLWNKCGCLYATYAVIYILFSNNNSVLIGCASRFYSVPQKGGMLGQIEGALYVQDVTSQADDAYWAEQTGRNTTAEAMRKGAPAQLRDSTPQKTTSKRYVKWRFASTDVTIMTWENWNADMFHLWWADIWEASPWSQKFWTILGKR